MQTDGAFGHFHQTCSSSFFLFSFSPEHKGKLFILYCSVVELDQKIQRGLGSIPPSSPSPIFGSSQHQRRSPWCRSTFGDGSETRWLIRPSSPPRLG